MSKYPAGSNSDRETLSAMPVQDLLDLLFLQIRNLWRVDGLYFLGMEERFGTEAATIIDAAVWQNMAQIEARALQKTLCVKKKPDISTIIQLLLRSSWALDQPFKAIKVSPCRATLSINRCRTQEARLNKNLEEFPCKKVRLGYLENFAKTLNPDVKVECITCPPDKHPDDLWCKWSFSL